MPVPVDWSRQFRDFLDAWKRNPRGEEFIGDNPFPRFVLAERAESWGDFLEWLNALQGAWCFRGQREAEWSLSTSLDRDVRRDISDPDGNTTGYYHLDRGKEAHKKLEEFQKHLRRNKLASMPADLGSCLALMQHYGAPTRFLDWTRSPFVAAYFALEEQARARSQCSAIWALDLDWLGRRARELIPGNLWPTDFDTAALDWEQDDLLIGYDQPTILRVEPRQSNKRMIAQNGVLLCKLKHKVYFSVSLMSMMIHPELVEEPVLRKLEIHTSQREEFLRRLKEKNIDRTSLFPDEDSQ